MVMGNVVPLMWLITAVATSAGVFYTHISVTCATVSNPRRMSDITSCPTHTLHSFSCHSHRLSTSGALLTHSNGGRPPQVSHGVNSYISHSIDFACKF